AEWIDEETEQILLPTIEACGSIHTGLRRLKVGGELLEHGQEIVVPEPRVIDAVNRANGVVGREDLPGLVATREGFLENATGRLGTEAIERVFGNSRQPAKLAKRPIIGNQIRIVSNRQVQVAGKRYLGRSFPAILGNLPLLAAVGRQFLQ